MPTEIIVIASGCTDDTESIVQSWAERDRRISLVVEPRREGKAAAVNRFLKEAREAGLSLHKEDVFFTARSGTGVAVLTAAPADAYQKLTKRFAAMRRSLIAR